MSVLLLLLLLSDLPADVEIVPAVDGGLTSVLSWSYEAVPVRYSSEWTVEDAITAYKDERLQPVDPAVYVRGRIEVSFDPFQFVMNEESCEPWSDGDAEYISTSGVQFFDGEALLYWSADAHGRTPPPIELTRSPDGQIVGATTTAGVEGAATTAPRESLMIYPRLAHLTGIDWLLQIDPLQDFRETAFTLRHLRDVAAASKGQADPGNSWSVESASADGDYVETDTIEMDISSGLIRSVVRTSTRVARNTDNSVLDVGESRVFRRAVAIAEQAAASAVNDTAQSEVLARGRYFPRVLPGKVTVLTELFGLGHGYHITLTDIGITEKPAHWIRPYVPIDSLITDLETRETSTILRSFDDDATRVAAFLRSNRIAAVPTGEAVIREDEHRTSSVLFLLLVNAIGLVALVAWIVWKRRSSSTGMVLFAASIIPVTAQCGDPGTQDVAALDSQISSRDPGSPSALDRMAAKAEVIAIPSCGFRAVVSVLELTQTDYDPELVASMIGVRQQGVHLADVHRTVADHGLTSEIRKNVRTKELYEALRPGELFLLPVTIDAQLTKHYVIVVRDDLTTVLVINPGVVVRRCTSANELFRSLNRADDIAGLLISRPPAPKADAGMASAVEVQRIPSDGSGKAGPGLAPTCYRLANTSDKAVVCARVKASCGCLSTQTRGWVLRPDESRIIEGRYVDTANGDQSIRVGFADGTHLVLDVPNPTSQPR